MASIYSISVEEGMVILKQNKTYVPGDAYIDYGYPRPIEYRKTEEMSAKDRFIEEINTKKEEAKLEAIRAAYEALGDEPTSDDGSEVVIKFSKKFEDDGTTYTYAAIGIKGMWYTTGRVNMTSNNWEALRIWLASTGVPTSEFKVMS